MRHIIVAALAALLLPASQLQAEEKALSLEFKTGWYSRYVLEADTLCYPRPVAQSELTLTLNRKPLDGFYFNVWGSTGLGGSDSPDLKYGNKVDYTIGRVWGWKGFEFNANLSYYDMGPVGSTNGDIWHPMLEVGRPFHVWERHKFTPFLRLTGVIPVKGTKPEGSMRVAAGARDSWQITQNLAFKTMLWVMHDDGGCGRDSGYLVRCSPAGVDWSITENLTLSAAYVVSSPITHLKDDDRKTENVLGAWLTVRF